VGRTFALAATEVTVAQFLRFRKDHSYQKTYSPTDEHPVNALTWYEAAAYCNWLSEQAGIPETEWCYEPHPQNGYGDGMKTRPGFLRKRGYRLPTEAEWEYACRAGAVTARYYGETEELLGEYAWYTRNSRDRVMESGGTRKPNDFGLCDMLGNALDWCQDGARPYPRQGRYTVLVDTQYIENIVVQDNRILRGGAFLYVPVHVRCAARDASGSAIHNLNLGFRPARTCP
jgi:formylglycine-generating enzyme required for sulfatase activity